MSFLLYLFGGACAAGGVMVSDRDDELTLFHYFVAAAIWPLLLGSVIVALLIKGVRSL